MYGKDQLRRFGLAERRRVARTLAGLTAQQWAAPSLCADWTVRDVVAHMADGVQGSTIGFIAGMVTVRFDIDEYNKKTAASLARRPTRELAMAFDSGRMKLFLKFNPGVLLVDTMVHHQDIRRPLGLGRDLPEDHLRACLEAITTSRFFAEAYKRADGLCLVATDLEWRSGSGGREVRGTAEALMMGLLGRRLERGELSDDSAFWATAS
ncbi:maleylpyruvate isomerase family mycothiol-dependent enzyme [Actinomadura sp. HBU206391]|uniref:maleylpyruvate isomerase family mycothiol-dependent enzyme n=1 Tax=Actinomadura sp. HBU206391 TaxID=2731692 RepID=UPI001650A7F4|nr:maleylpyruvate isomerase family mycothiol-dependent enzyme [Actinomadura sp. HBU206391]MBC6456904.1 maleylpyruvate isomerase family mycothiol-dependent enzyme [Actinomadura sp. HBU206391]